MLLLLASLALARDPDPLVIDPGLRWQQGESAPTLDRPWWSDFEDPQLTDFVTEALGENPDLGAAFARVRQAEAAALQSFSTLMPRASFDVTTNGQPTQNVAFCAVGNIFDAESGAFPTTPDANLCWQGAAQLVGSWQVPIFGRRYLDWQASRFEAEATRGDRGAQALQLSAAVARAYFDALTANAQVAVVADQIGAQEEFLDLLQLRFEAGTGEGLDVLQQRRALANTRALLPPSQAAQVAARAQLAALLGQPPGTVEELGAAVPLPGPLPPAGLPAELVQTRPDLRAARARLRAADRRETAAWLELLPSLTVTGATGWQYAYADELTTIDAWSVGGTFSIPLFQGGARIAGIRQADAAEDAAIYAWNSTVLGALQEVESSLARDVAQAERLELVRAQVEAAELAYDDARERFVAGLGTYLDVLTAQAAALQAELTLVQARRDRAEARLQLHQALGGSWTRDPRTVSTGGIP